MKAVGGSVRYQRRRPVDAEAAAEVPDAVGRALELVLELAGQLTLVGRARLSLGKLLSHWSNLSAQ